MKPGQVGVKEDQLDLDDIELIQGHEVEEGVKGRISGYLSKPYNLGIGGKSHTHDSKHKVFRLFLSEEEGKFIEYLIAEKYIPQLSEFETADAFIHSVKEITKNSAVCAQMPKQLLGCIEKFLKNHSSSESFNLVSDGIKRSLSQTSSVEGAHSDRAFDWRSAENSIPKSQVDQ